MSYALKNPQVWVPLSLFAGATWLWATGSDPGGSTCRLTKADGSYIHVTAEQILVVTISPNNFENKAMSRLLLQGKSRIDVREPCEQILTLCGVGLVRMTAPGQTSNHLDDQPAWIHAAKLVSFEDSKYRIGDSPEPMTRLLFADGTSFTVTEPSHRVSVILGGST